MHGFDISSNVLIFFDNAQSRILLWHFVISQSPYERRTVDIFIELNSDFAVQLDTKYEYGIPDLDLERERLKLCLFI